MERDMIIASVCVCVKERERLKEMIWLRVQIQNIKHWSQHPPPHLSSMGWACAAFYPPSTPHPSSDPPSPSSFSHAQSGSRSYSGGYPEVPHDHAWKKSKGREWLDVDSYHNNLLLPARGWGEEERERERERQHTWYSEERELSHQSGTKHMTN